MRHLFIVNLKAGKGKSLQKLRSQIDKAFPDGGYELRVTAGAGDARKFTQGAAQMAAQRGEPVRIYACGGDGTLNEVVNGAAGFDNAAVTNVPLGTGNDFLRIFGKEGRKKFTDIASLKDGPQTPMDLMDCNGLLGIDVVCAGVDARVAANVHHFKSLPLVTGTGAYVLSLVDQAVLRGITRPMTVDMGPIHHEGPTAILCICNGRHYGGGFCPVPDALPDDGVLDMLLIGDVDLLRFGKYVGKYAVGRYKELPNVVKDWHGDSVTFSSSEEIVVVVDGETMRDHQFTVRLSEKKVNFFRPAGVEYAIQN